MPWGQSPKFVLRVAYGWVQPANASPPKAVDVGFTPLHNQSVVVTGGQQTQFREFIRIVQAMGKSACTSVTFGVDSSWTKANVGLVMGSAVGRPNARDNARNW